MNGVLHQKSSGNLCRQKESDLDGSEFRRWVYERALRPRPIKLLKLLYAQHVSFHKLSTMPRENQFSIQVRDGTRRNLHSLHMIRVQAHVGDIAH